MPTPGPAFWIVAGLIMVALEMVVPGLVIIWFGVAALVTGVAAFFVPNPVVQLLVFAALAAALVVMSQLIARRLTRPEPEPTGASRLQGPRGTVTADIRPAEMGRVKVLGEEWRATAKTGIAAGSPVRILEVIGTHLVVGPWEEK